MLYLIKAVDGFEPTIALQSRVFTTWLYRRNIQYCNLKKQDRSRKLFPSNNPLENHFLIIRIEKSQIAHTQISLYL